MTTHRLRIGVSAAPELMLGVILLWVKKEQRERGIEEESLPKFWAIQDQGWSCFFSVLPPSFPSVSS